MPDVVVAGASGGAGQHREHRLSTVEGLDQGLLIDAEHDSPLGSIEIQSDDVADLLDDNGSLDSFHELCLCGANPNTRHTRETID